MIAKEIKALAAALKTAGLLPVSDSMVMNTLLQHSGFVP
jgi:hypothetical protein